MRRVVLVLVVLFVSIAACGRAELRADAGADIEVPVGASPTFDGCASQGDMANYRWTIVDAPPTMGDDIGKEIRALSTDCSFTLEASMLAEEAGRWEIELVVVGDDGASSSDTVVVTVGG